MSTMKLEGLRVIVRDAPFGQLIRYVTGNRVFRYPEELEGFQCPCGYNKENKTHSHEHTSPTPPTHDLEKVPSQQVDLEKIATAQDTDKPAPPPSSSSSGTGDLERTPTSTSHLQRTQTLPYTRERLEADISIALQKTKTSSHPVAPTKTADGVVLVDWYTTDDKENPQNWSQGKKAWTAFLVCAYTFVVYASSSIYVSSTLLVMERFGVGEFKASLGLALYVLGMPLLSSDY